MSALHKAYGYHQNDPACRDRLDRFRKATGLYTSDEVRFPVRANFPPGLPLDHVTIWTDDEDRIFVMTEPYGDPADHEVELNASGLAWIRVPAEYAPYGGGTSTYLFTFPLHSDALRKVGQRLGVPLRAL